MPSSSFEYLKNTVGVIHMIQPASILEVGIGFGKYGFLVRELMDLKPDEEKGYASWSMRIDGIEIFEKYITPIHRYIYDNIYIGNAITILDQLNTRYDLLLAVDVLEHFTKENGVNFIQKALERSREVLLVTPYAFYEQGEVFNNPHEAHMSAWSIKDFEQLGAKYIWRDGIGLAGLFTSKEYPLPKFEEQFGEYELNKLQSALFMYVETNQFLECIDLAKRYLEYRPDDDVAHVLLSLSLEQMGLVEDAKHTANIALKINPEQKFAKDILNRLS